MWRKKLLAQGWGFTLKGKDDWRLDKFNTDAPNHTFTTCYGADGTGNILSSDNIKHFEGIIRSQTRNKMLNLVIADGGFSVEGEENLQEVKMRQLILCQFLTAFTVLAKHGNFVCKIFDVFTPFTVGLVYIMYRYFQKICIIKPFTSRPANSERYLVCKNLILPSAPITSYLFRINDKMNNMEQGKELWSPVDLELILKDKQFVEYIRESNISVITQQIEALEELFKYLEDDGLLSLDQFEIKNRCLQEWNVPPTLHKRPYPEKDRERRMERGYHNKEPPGIYPKQSSALNSKLDPTTKNDPPSDFYLPAPKTKQEQAEDARKRHTDSIYSRIPTRQVKPKVSSPKTLGDKLLANNAVEDLMAAYLKKTI